MNWLPTILHEPMLERLGWTLVHSVWECAAVALVLAILLLALRRSEARYVAAYAALLACVLAPAMTFWMLGRAEAAPVLPAEIVSTPEFRADPSMMAGIGTAGDAPAMSSPDRSLQLAVPVAAVVWLAGVVLLCVRHVMGWMSLRQMRQNALVITDPAALDRLHTLMQLLGLHRAIELTESARVQVPSMIGWLRPMVLLPVGALSGLSPLHLEAILAHELAHIRRHDYLANLLQTLIETLLFYHPAVWWISKVIRQEREHCCDDLAVKVIGDAREYGLALAAMEELRTPGEFAMAANGGSLLKRIRRLVKPEPRRTPAAWPMLGMICVIVLIGASARMKQAQSAQIADAAPATQPSSKSPNADSNRIPSTQPNVDVVARQELSEAARAYTAAQLQRIQAEAGYEANDSRVLSAKKTEEELEAKYQEKLRHVLISNEVMKPQADAQQALPEVLAAIREAFGYQPDPNLPISQRLQIEMLVDQIRGQRARVDELNMKLAQARSQYGPGHPAIAATEREIMQIGEQQRATETELKRMEAEVAALKAEAITQPLRISSDELARKLAEVTSQTAQLKQQQTQLVQAGGQQTPQLRDLNAQLSELARHAAEIRKVLHDRAQAAPAPTYYISGAPNSGMYPIPDGQSISLVDVINRAGAIRGEDMEKFVMMVHQAPVDRQKSTFMRVQDAVNEPADKRTQVFPGDVIMVTTQGALPLAPEARYTVEGKVNKPGFYPLQKNMSLLQAVVAAGVNPPEMYGWTVEWTRAIPKSSNFVSRNNAQRADVQAMTVPVADLIGGTIGMEMVSAGDKITVNPPEGLPAPAGR